MAIFVASTKSISRGKGQSAVASASYRAGEKLEDNRYGKTHDYSKRHGVMSADIILPTSLAEQNITIERGELWNLAEKSETRKNSRVAREWLVNLPHELDEQERKELAHNFSQSLADKFNVIADCAIHRPTEKEIERGADARNFHAHIMLTTRQAELDQNGKIKLAAKSVCELSDTDRKKLGLCKAKDEVTEIRQLWERLANEKLAEHGCELIDSRSYQDQGLDVEPQLKMGSVATKRERDKYEKERIRAKKAAARNEPYEIDDTPATVRGAINKAIKQRNEIVFTRKLNAKKQADSNDRIGAAVNKAIKLTEYAARLTENATNNTVFTNKRTKHCIKRTRDAQHAVDVSKRNTERASSVISESARNIEQSVSSIERVAEFRPVRARATPSPFDEQYRASVNRREQAAIRLAERERELDRQTRRHKYEDERRADSVQRIQLAFAHKLLAAEKQDALRLRWEYGEKIEDYPNKYDQRQVKTIKHFTESLNLKSHTFVEQLHEVRNLIDDKFIADNRALIELVKDPKAERDQYNDRLSAFVQFRESIDTQRAESTNSLAVELGGSCGEVGRMTREIATSFSYIQALDAFINDDSYTGDARELAREHRADTLNRTCQQFKFALADVNKLPSSQRNSHVTALNSSLERFSLTYGSELSENQNKAIQDGLRSFDRDMQTIQSQSRGYRR